MSDIELLDSLHTKILHSKFAETITEQEIDALIDCKAKIKETYNQALEDFKKELIKIYNKRYMHDIYLDDIDDIVNKLKK